MQPLMRLVYGPKSCAISAQLISSPFLIVMKIIFKIGAGNPVVSLNGYNKFTFVRAKNACILKVTVLDGDYI